MKNKPKAETASPVDEGADNGICTLTLPALAIALKEGLHPWWWGRFMTPEEFADPSTLRRAFEEFADRVNGLGGLLWQADVDSNDAMTGGQVLRYLAEEAQLLLGMTLHARRLLDAKKPGKGVAV